MSSTNQSTTTKPPSAVTKMISPATKKATPVVVTQVSAPVVAVAPVDASVTSAKSVVSKKTKTATATATVAVATEPVTEPVTDALTVGESPKKKKTSDAGGVPKKKKTSKSASTDVEKSQSGGVVSATDMSTVESAVDAGMDAGVDAISRKRTFKICRENGEFSSRLIGKTPKQAANKALTALFREALRNGAYEKSGDGGFKADFTIRETTRRSNGKEYSYSGLREKLSQPTVYRIVVGEEIKEIINNYRNSVMKMVAAPVAVAA